jgi:hypothetical protein
MSSTVTSYTLWRVRAYPLFRFPAERVWRLDNGRLYYSRNPKVETPETVRNDGADAPWFSTKSAWYQRLRKSLQELGQQNPVCVEEHLTGTPFCFRGGSRCWALATLGQETVDAVVSLPTGLTAEEAGLDGEPVEVSEEAIMAQFTDCKRVHIDGREWDARPPQIEIYEQKARRLRRQKRY